MGSSESIETGAEVHSSPEPQTLSAWKPPREAPPKFYRSIVQASHFSVYDDRSSMQPLLMVVLPVLFDGYRGLFSIAAQFDLLQLCKQTHLLLRSYFQWIKWPQYEKYVADFTFAWEPQIHGRLMFSSPEGEAAYREEARNRHERDTRILRDLLAQEGGDPDLSSSGIDGKLYSISFVADKDGKAVGMLAYLNARGGSVDKDIRYYNVVGWSFIPDRQSDDKKSRIEGYLVRLELRREEVSYSITILPEHLFEHKRYSNEPNRSEEAYKEHITQQVKSVMLRYRAACCD